MAGKRQFTVLGTALLISVLTVSSLVYFAPSLAANGQSGAAGAAGAAVQAPKATGSKSASLASILGSKEAYNLPVQVSQVTGDDEDEYRRLGLTPNHGITYQVTDLDGNPVGQSETIHGRFLHITDMHPDHFIEDGFSITDHCHRDRKGILDVDRCHKFGDSMTDNDSPVALYNATLAWVRANIRDKVDFVVWTGDNIRHDSDRRYPRLEYDIFRANGIVSKQMSHTFMDDGEEDVMPQDRRVKIVPSLGNNDVYPHNLVAPGPTLQTREMFKIWRDFVPAEQMHTFDRGIYFFREVIPGRLAVLSINTLYFYKANPLNDNCDNKKQPGYKLFQWIGITLKELRRRNMKVWLTGHVPPIPKNLHYSCYTKMAVWMHEYRDIIIGGLWGHMNTDHFVPLDSVSAWKSIEKRLKAMGLDEDAESLDYLTYDSIDAQDDNTRSSNEESAIAEFEDVMELYDALDLLDPDFGVTRVGKGGGKKKAPRSHRYDNAPQGKMAYLEGIRDNMYARINEKTMGEHGSRYAFAHITASVIPTYNPAVRVWEYNVTELFSGGRVSYEPWGDFFARMEQELDEQDAFADEIMSLSDSDPRKKQAYTLEADTTIPDILPEGSPLGPGYKEQTFTPERYTQYFVDLQLAQSPDYNFSYEPQYSTDKAPYNMPSLVAENWINLALKLAESGKGGKDKKGGKGKKGGKDKKKGKNGKGGNDDDDDEALWESFLDRAFAHTGYESHKFAQLL